MTETGKNDSTDPAVQYIFVWPYDARTRVAIAGSFNSWKAEPMQPQKDRKWESRVSLRVSQTPHHVSNRTALKKIIILILFNFILKNKQNTTCK